MLENLLLFQGGELLHWNGASFKAHSAAAHLTGGDTSAALHNLNSTSPWLSSETLKHKVHSKFPL
jgi:hypothetical protein